MSVIEYAAQELVGMCFSLPDIRRRRYSMYTILSYDAERNRLAIVAGKREYPTWWLEPSSFGAAWDMGGWEIESDNDSCTNCDSYPVKDNDYLCYWCRFNQALTSPRLFTS